MRSKDTEIALEPFRFSVRPLSAKDFDSLPIRCLTGFLLQELWGVHSQDACSCSRPHVVFLQDVYQ